VRHRDCFEASAIASRSSENATGRYSLLGLSEDILDVIALAERGGIGPVGPEFQRLYWNGEVGSWTSAKPIMTTANEVPGSSTPEKPSGEYAKPNEM